MFTHLRLFQLVWHLNLPSLCRCELIWLILSPCSEFYGNKKNTFIVTAKQTFKTLICSFISLHNKLKKLDIVIFNLKFNAGINYYFTFYHSESYGIFWMQFWAAIADNHVDIDKPRAQDPKGPGQTLMQTIILIYFVCSELKWL